MKKKTLSKLCVGVLAGAMTFSAFAFGGCNSDKTPTTTTPPVPETFSVDFNQQLADMQNSWEKTTDATSGVSYYGITNVVYCENPTHYKQQAMNIYVPAGYLNADGTINKSTEINGYTAETAPIIFINNVSGYSGGAPWTLTGANRKARKQGWFTNYLARGFVIVLAGERGLNTYTQEEDGTHMLGVAPISLVDLKAGIRFLRHNDAVIPGDCDKIISNGVSAGGNCSALLGVTGDTDIFDSYLEAIGAVMDESDAVFASQDYCPITDLDHATLAYEWFWQGDYTTDADEAAGTLMAKAYAEYFNGLHLVDEDGNELTLAEDGSRSGTFYDWMIAQFEKSYEAYVDFYGADYDSSKYDWLDYDETNGATISGLQDMIDSGYNIRQKALWSFDPYDFNSTGDCGVFGVPNAKTGTADEQRHFTPAIPGIIEELEKEGINDFSEYKQQYIDDTTNEEVLRMIAYYSPFHYITEGETTISEHFRICVGTQDRDTSTTISATLALYLMNYDIDVSYELMWNQVHEDADVQNGFEDWVDSICKAN